MKHFPSEFEDLLSPAGRRVLAARDPALCGALASGRTRFVSARGLLDAARARAVPALLERALGECLELLADPIPRSSLTGMKVAYRELLPKTVSVRTAMLDGRRTVARTRAEEIGLVAMLRSPSFHAFAQALSGYPLRRRWGLQALCYRPGDYAGPHNDHHPDEPEARDGYTNLHLSFCSAGVAQQWLVYERGGHFWESRTSPPPAG